MNHAHPSHCTERVDPGVKFVLRGWDSGNGIAHYNLRYGDVRIRNMPTNSRDGAGTNCGGHSFHAVDWQEMLEEVAAAGGSVDPVTDLDPGRIVGAVMRKITRHGTLCLDGTWV